MKIVFIISSLSSGGAERVVCNLANNFSKIHKVIILTFFDSESFYKLNEKVIHKKLNLLKESRNKFESIKNNFNRILVLKNVLKNIDADINISFMTNTNILSIISSKLNRQKIIIAERIVYDFYQSKALDILRKFIYTKSNMLVTQTMADKKSYSFMQNVVVIYNPLEINILKHNKENIVLAVGRLDKQKGFHNLIKAFSEVKSENWRLCIAGEGIEKENLEKLIVNLKLENVELIGKRKDIFNWYAKSSIFVLSSQKEGFPNVLLEAMGIGCASISFDCPNGPAEIIQDEVNGILVENQNTKQLSYQIHRLIEDRNLRQRLVEESVKIKEKYNIVKITREWEEVINKVIAND